MRRGTNRIALVRFWCSHATLVSHYREGVRVRPGSVWAGQPLVVRCQMRVNARRWAGSAGCVGLTSFFLRSEMRKLLKSHTLFCLAWKVWSIKPGVTLSMVARHHTPLRHFMSSTHGRRFCGAGGVQLYNISKISKYSKPLFSK